MIESKEYDEVDEGLFRAVRPFSVISSGRRENICMLNTIVKNNEVFEMHPFVIKVLRKGM